MIPRPNLLWVAFLISVRCEWEERHLNPRRCFLCRSLFLMDPMQIGCGLGASKSKVVEKRGILSGMIISHFERAAKEGRKRFARRQRGEDVKEGIYDVKGK